LSIKFGDFLIFLFELGVEGINLVFVLVEFFLKFVDFLSELSDFSLRLLSEFFEERICRHFLFFDFVFKLFS
jgi:hypothetical protein